jgi:hypothetical protein
MSAALNVTKHAEWTGLIPEQACNSLRNHFTFGFANALACSNKRLAEFVSRRGTGLLTVTIGGWADIASGAISGPACQSEDARGHSRPFNHSAPDVDNDQFISEAQIYYKTCSRV